MQSKLIGMAMAEAMKVSPFVSFFRISYEISSRRTSLMLMFLGRGLQLFSSSGGQTTNGGGQQDVVNAAGKRQSSSTRYLSYRLRSKLTAHLLHVIDNF